jgi:hypothetical protein
MGCSPDDKDVSRGQCQDLLSDLYPVKLACGYDLCT